jgi:hypothetical protein
VTRSIAAGAVTAESQDDADDALSPEVSLRVAHLLINEVVSLYGFWHDGEDDKVGRRLNAVQLSVNCSDVFAWGCADAEPLPFTAIPTAYAMWQHDEVWGLAAWCVMRRKQMPQPPVEKLIRAAGVWDLDALVRGAP